MLCRPSPTLRISRRTVFLKFGLCRKRDSGKKLADAARMLRAAESIVHVLPVKKGSLQGRLAAGAPGKANKVAPLGTAAASLLSLEPGQMLQGDTVEEPAAAQTQNFFEVDNHEENMKMEHLDDRTRCGGLSDIFCLVCSMGV